MLHSKKKTINIILFILVITTILFIWKNSLKDRDTSSLQSSKFTDFFKSLFDPNNKISYSTFSFYVRKAAHFSEYALLGFLCMCIHMNNKKINIFAVLYLPLLIAVIDETIQSFTGRGSSTRDVLIDHSGAIFGILFSLLIINLIHYILKKYSHSTQK